MNSKKKNIKKNKAVAPLSIDEPDKAKKPKCESKNEDQTASYSHAYVKFTGNKTRGNEYATVPIHRIKGLGENVAYNSLSEYRIYWRNPDSESEDGRRSTDDEDYYPGQIVKVGKSSQDIEEWLHKNGGKRIVTPSVKDLITTESRSSSSSSKLPTAKQNLDRKERKNAVESSVDTNLNSILKKVRAQQKVHSEDANSAGDQPSCSSSSKNFTSTPPKETHPGNCNTSEEESKVIQVLFREIDKLRQENKTLLESNNKYRLENDKLQQKLESVEDNKKSLELIIKLLSDKSPQIHTDVPVRDVDQEASTSATSSTKKQEVAPKDLAGKIKDIWGDVDEAVESDVASVAGDSYSGNSTDDHVNQDDNRRSKKKKDNSTADNEQTFVREKLIERKELAPYDWCASLKAGGGNYKDKIDLLTEENEKIYLGYETWIPVISWVTVKKQSKDKMFISHLSVALLGEECYLYNKTGTGKKNEVRRKFPEKVTRVVCDFVWRKLMRDNNYVVKVADALLKKIDVEALMATGVREKDPQRQDKKAEARKKKNGGVSMKKNEKSVEKDKSGSSGDESE